ncbi:MAG: hypothetical protein AAFQ41_02110 [Cyanobacteria bacterium J06623_7]
MSIDNSTVDLNHLLNSCITVESWNLAPKTAIPQQVCFRLDAETIKAIEQIKISQKSLQLSQTNLTALRCYALFNLPSAPKFSYSQQSYLKQAALTFSTHYPAKFPSEPLLRSTIGLRGKILQQIKQDLVRNPILLEHLLEAHYWLTDEILSQLPLKSQADRSWLIYGGIILTIFAICGLNWYFLAHSPAIRLIICSLLLAIGFTAIAIYGQLRWWAIYQLAGKIFAQKTVSRRLSLKILSYLI